MKFKALVNHQGVKQSWGNQKLYLTFRYGEYDLDRWRYLLLLFWDKIDTLFEYLNRQNPIKKRLACSCMVRSRVPICMRIVKLLM